MMTREELKNIILLIRSAVTMYDNGNIEESELVSRIEELTEPLVDEHIAEKEGSAK